MTQFKYHGYIVDINKDDDTGYFTWSAERFGNKRFQVINKKKYGLRFRIIGDKEGGDLSSMSNARFAIKKWIDESITSPFDFSQYNPELVIERFD